MKHYKNLIIGIGFTILTAVLMSAGVAFIRQSSMGLYYEKLNYLAEISIKSAENIYEQINNGLSTMAAIATFVGEQKQEELEQVLPTLMGELDSNSFQKIGIITPEGKATSTDCFVYDFSNQEFFKKAMQGERVVSDSYIDEMNQEKINYFAVPIYKGQEIMGVLFGTKSQNQLSKSIHIENFNGEGYSYIIKRDGSPVIQTSHKQGILEFDNLFDVMYSEGISQKDRVRLESDIGKDKNGSFEYKRNGILRQIYYAKINVNDWYLLSVVPSNVISYQSRHLILKMTVMTIMMIVLIGIGSMIIIFVLYHNNKRLQKIAYIDSVTGYSNLRKFNMDVSRILKTHSEYRFAMVIFDINKFKLINDMFGYEMGNRVLRFIAEVIARNKMEIETFSRSASDNFNLLMVYVSDKQILERMEKISKEIQGFIEENTIELVYGIYVIVDPSLEINIINDRANISKGIAKKQSLTKYHFFKEEDRQVILQEKEIENVMEKSLENHDFKVYLQPKYLLKTNQIAGAEALVRWIRPHIGMVSPGEFIPLFEKNGFIRKLDLYMFEQVCSIMAQWIQKAPKSCIVPISVNISRVHLSNKDLPYTLSKIAKKYGVEPQMIEIELTESAVFGDVEVMIEIMKKIKYMGFLISIDDFGSGYSSLSAIKDLPADYVKIDKTFLDESIKDRKGKQILYSIIDMCEKLNISVIAEGVETREQIDILKNAGCELVQGYYYSKPISVPAFNELIRNKNIQ